MKWSFRLGSLFGIPVYLHFTFLLLLGGLAMIRLIQAGPGAALASLVLISTVFGLVVLHEMGHALAARHFGIGTRDVTLLPIGGIARLERLPATPRQELWIALAGPAVNLTIAAVIGIFLTLAGLGGGVGQVGGSFAAQLFALNIGLFVFNMLPAFPMDGGRVLRASLARRMGNVRATEIAAAVGKGMAVLLGVIGLFLNPMLVLIALFVWFGANQEVMLARGFFGPRIGTTTVLDPDDWPISRGTGWSVHGTPRPREVRVRVYRGPSGWHARLR
jgi:Zn-dependent protease